MNKPGLGCSLLWIGACTVPGDDTSPRRILPLGDSITEGVPHSYRYPLSTMLADEGIGFDLVGSRTAGAESYPDGWDRDHEGHSGWMTVSIAEELSTWLPGYDVDIALVHLGTNDAGADDPAGSTDAMTSIVQQLRAHNPHVSVCLAQILPFGSGPDADPELGGLNDFVRDWNDRLRVLAADLSTDGSPVRLADMYSDFDDSDLEDGIHPTRAGAEKMATQWLDCIADD